MESQISPEDAPASVVPQTNYFLEPSLNVSSVEASGSPDSKSARRRKNKKKKAYRRKTPTNCDDIIDSFASLRLSDNFVPLPPLNLTTPLPPLPLITSTIAPLTFPIIETAQKTQDVCFFCGEAGHTHERGAVSTQCVNFVEAKQKTSKDLYIVKMDPGGRRFRMLRAQDQLGFAAAGTVPWYYNETEEDFYILLAKEERRGQVLHNFIGGKRDFMSETFITTARREFKEETLDLLPIAHEPLRYIIWSNYDKYVICIPDKPALTSDNCDDEAASFIDRWSQSKIRPNDSNLIGFTWIPLSKLNQKEFTEATMHPYTIKVVKAILRLFLSS